MFTVVLIIISKCKQVLGILRNFAKMIQSRDNIFEDKFSIYMSYRSILQAVSLS